MKNIFKGLLILILLISFTKCENIDGTNDDENNQELNSQKVEVEKLIVKAKEYNFTEEEFFEKGLIDKGEYFIFGGDIVFHKNNATHQKFIDRILGIESEDSKQTKGLSWLIPNTWPNGVITYSFYDLSSNTKNKIRDAMDELEKICGVKYIHMEVCGAYSIRKSLDSSNGGMSSLGFCPFAFFDVGKTDKVTILHELCHGLGMHHENQRPDSDNYITVNYDNIEFRYQYAFWKLSGVQTYGSYDYYSIMHYPGKAFSINDKITIKTHDPAYQSIIGKADDLSEGDKKTLKRLYPGEPCGYWYDVKVQYPDLSRPIYRQDYYKYYYWKNPGHWKNVYWYSYKKYYWTGPWYKRKLKSKWVKVYRKEYVAPSGWTYKWMPYAWKTITGYHTYTVTEKRLKSCF